LVPIAVLPAVLLVIAVAGAAPKHSASGRGSRPRHPQGAGKGHHGGSRGGGKRHHGGHGSASDKPGKPIAVGFGYRPQVLVDEAGVAHITWATSSEEHGPAGEHTYTAGWDNYCRLARGASKCGDHAKLDAPIAYPPHGADEVLSPLFGNSPGADQDIGEGSLPLATGNQLSILAHRPGNKVEVPGGISEDVNFMWTSDDGGKSFSGPGLTSTMDYYGGAASYGSPASIGILGFTGELLTESKTAGHVFFQEVRAGTFAPAGARVDLGRGKNDLLARRQIVADGDRPLVAFDDLKDVTVREYKGKGNIDDAANWSTSKFPGTDPSLASGPHGTWLTYYPAGHRSPPGPHFDPNSFFPKAVVVKLVDGHRSGPETPVFPSAVEGGSEDQLAEAADGELLAGWVEEAERDEAPRYLMVSTSDEGHHWTKPRKLYVAAPKDGIGGLQIGIGPDGGGVAVFVHGGNGDKATEAKLRDLFGVGGQVVAVPFGARGSTGKKGLGTGGSGHAGCLDIRFGAVHAHVDAGCFLRVATKKDPKGDASIAYGGVHVNGLEIRPDAPGTAIVIDDSTHTIESKGGNVSILLQHPGIPDIKLWDGPLNADLGAHDNVGDPLFSLPTTGFHADVLGFEALGTVTPILGDESVSIPLSLKMPSYFNVPGGSATLAANMAEGLERPSLHIAIPDVSEPGLALRGGAIDWAGPEDQWTGTGEFEMTPGGAGGGLDAKGARIAFDHGDFTSGGFDTAPYPGTPIFHNAYLEDLGASFNLHPPPSLTGNAEIGAVAHGGGIYSLEASGPLTTGFGNPSTMDVSGDGAIYGVPLNSAHATFTTAGTFHETGILGFDSFGLEIGGTVDATTDLAAGTTSGTIAGTFSFAGQGVEESLPFNDTGFGFCKEFGVSPASVSSGFVFKWEGGVEVFPTGCADHLADAGVGG
jgi:hypothetical protein